MLLIRKAQDRVITNGEYSEKHHIFPKAIFGPNKSIVKLTAREHFVAHLLLLKDFQKRYGAKHWKTIKMAHAAWLMAIVKNQKITSRTFEVLKKVRSLTLMGHKVPKKIRQKLSILHKGENNPFFGKSHSEKSKLKMAGRYYSDEEREQRRLNAIGKLHTKATKNKIGKAHRGRVHSDEARSNMSHGQLRGQSLDMILNEIIRIIVNEDPASPLLDDNISKELRSMNINVAQNSISRYRKKLCIPKSLFRKF